MFGPMLQLGFEMEYGISSSSFDAVRSMGDARLMFTGARDVSTNMQDKVSTVKEGQCYTEAGESRCTSL